MATRPVPHQCIWCLKYPSSTTSFNSESHVLPECVRNIKEQVLPKGVVCDECNAFFGHKLEPILIDEPIFKTLAAILELRDIDSKFTYKHSPSGVRRIARIAVEVSTTTNRITLTTQYRIEGQPNQPSEVRPITEYKDYDQKDLAFLSRAVHKIAFESVAHNLFVGTGVRTQSKQMEDVDVFDPRFNVIRQWVRNGEPQHSVRPVLRFQEFGEVERQEQYWEWGGKMVAFPQCIYYELNLFRGWHIVSLISPANRAEADLVNWLKRGKPNHQVWMVGDELQSIE